MFATQLALIISSTSLALFYITSGWGRVLNTFFLILAGFASGGTDMVLTGSLAVDLGGGKRNCISGVAGIINGCGVLGAVLQGGLVAFTSYVGGQTGIAFLMSVRGNQKQPSFLPPRVNLLEGTEGDASVLPSVKLLVRWLAAALGFC